MQNPTQSIYPWYNQDRWLRERYQGDERQGWRLLTEYGPPGSGLYLRHSYASFRVNGLEYARLNADGSIRYGVERAPLQPSDIEPAKLVQDLQAMFLLLAEAEGNPEPACQRVRQQFAGAVARFLEHVARNHQAEHWLESCLLQDASLLPATWHPVRSQVVVGFQPRTNKRSTFRFIDLLALDRQNHQVVVVELKMVTASTEAIQQARAYVDWAQSCMDQLLDPSNGYFPRLDDPQTYRPAVAFVAPSFAGGFTSQVEALLPGYAAMTFAFASDWRRRICLQKAWHRPAGASVRLAGEAAAPVMPAPTDEMRTPWFRCPLIQRIKVLARRFCLPERPIDRDGQTKYIDLDGSGGVAAQIHRHIDRTDGWVLVIGNAGSDCPSPSRLEAIVDYSRLSGDWGPNRRWLRAEGEVFGKRHPARAYYVPLPLATAAEEDAAWGEIRALLAYSAGISSGMANALPDLQSPGTSVLITHGDIDGMVCAAQLIRREKSGYEVRFTNARYLANTLSSIANARSVPRRLYITDIPASADAVAMAGKLAQREVDIYWIDHHPWVSGLQEQLEGLCKLVIHQVGTQTPAGVLVARWLGPADPYSQQLGEICYPDPQACAWQKDWTRLLASYVAKSSPGVVERLANNEPFTADDRQRIDRQVELEGLAEEILKASPQTAKTSSGRAMAFYDVSAIPGVYLGRRVFDVQPVDYCLIRLTDRKWHISCRARTGLSLDQLVGDHCLEGANLVVAGSHATVLSMELKGPGVPASADAVVAQWLLGRL